MAYEDNLLLVFENRHNHIYATDGLQKEVAFFEFLKLIFCKTLDEQNVGQEPKFYTSSKERSNRDGQLTVKKRVSAIFEDVKKRYPQIFQENDRDWIRPSFTVMDSLRNSIIQPAKHSSLMSTQGV